MGGKICIKRVRTEDTSDQSTESILSLNMFTEESIREEQGSLLGHSVNNIIPETANETTEVTLKQVTDRIITIIGKVTTIDKIFCNSYVSWAVENKYKVESETIKWLTTCAECDYACDMVIYYIHNISTGRIITCPTILLHKMAVHNKSSVFLQDVGSCTIDLALATKIFNLRPGVDYSPQYTEYSVWRYDSMCSVVITTPDDTYIKYPNHDLYYRIVNNKYLELICYRRAEIGSLDHIIIKDLPLKLPIIRGEHKLHIHTEQYVSL